MSAIECVRKGYLPESQLILTTISIAIIKQVHVYWEYYWHYFLLNTFNEELQAHSSRIRCMS